LGINATNLFFSFLSNLVDKEREGLDVSEYDYHEDGLSLELVANGPVAPHSIHSQGLLAVIPDFVVVSVEGIALASK
jgi:hypothetical protein